jgi:hypothetical protein
MEKWKTKSPRGRRKTKVIKENGRRRCWDCGKGVREGGSRRNLRVIYSHDVL